MTFHLDKQLVLEHKGAVANTTNGREVLRDRVTWGLHQVALRNVHGVYSYNSSERPNLLQPELIDLHSADSENDILSPVFGHPATDRSNKV